MDSVDSYFNSYFKLYSYSANAPEETEPHSLCLCLNIYCTYHKVTLKADSDTSSYFK